MKYPISGCTIIYVSLLALFITSGQVHASSQWPFPREAFPHDAIYYQYLIYGSSLDSRFKTEEETLEVARLIPEEANEPETDQSIWNQQNLAAHENYDYWEPR